MDEKCKNGKHHTQLVWLQSSSSSENRLAVHQDDKNKLPCVLSLQLQVCTQTKNTYMQPKACV